MKKLLQALLYEREDSIPLFILVPRSIVGGIIGWKGKYVKELATSNMTKIHIDTKKSGMSEENGVVQVVVEVHGSANGCAEVAGKILEKVYLHNGSNSFVNVTFPNSYTEYLFGNKNFIRNLERTNDVSINKVKSTVKSNCIVKTYGTLQNSKNVISSLMNEIYTLYNAECKPDSSDFPDEKFLFLQCDVLYSVLCNISTERILNYLNGLNAKKLPKT